MEPKKSFKPFIIAGGLSGAGGAGHDDERRTHTDDEAENDHADNAIDDVQNDNALDVAEALGHPRDKVDGHALAMALNNFYDARNGHDDEEDEHHDEHDEESAGKGM
jgi:hypothetical protein